MCSVKAWTVLLTLVTACGCAAPAVDRLLASADRGLQLAREDDEQLGQLLDRALDEQLEQIHLAFDDDVDLVVAAVADGTPQLTADWVKEARAGYALLLSIHYRNRMTVRQLRSTMQDNLQQTRRLVTEAKQLNAFALRYQQFLTTRAALAPDLSDNQSARRLSAPVSKD